MISFITNKKGLVTEFFLQNPTREAHLRELARKTGISFPWVRKLVYGLAKEGLLLRKKEHGLVLIKANRDNRLFRAFKQSYNLLSLHTSGLVSKLDEEFHRPQAIVLFGSYSKGEDIETSDIDIAVISNKDYSADLSGFEKKLQRSIKIQVLPRERIEREFWNTLANGIVLSGYLDVK